MRVAFYNMATNTGSRSPADVLIALRTSEVAENCSNASSRSQRRRANSVSWPALEELLWRAAFRVFALRPRALASLLLALERRRIAYPKAQDYADFQRGIRAEICDWRNGVQYQFAPQKP